MKENNPLFTLTIGEFSDLVRQIINEEIRKLQPAETVIEKNDPLNITDLTEFLRCSKASVHNYKKQGLPFYKIGRKVLFKKEEVLRFLDVRRKK